MKCGLPAIYVNIFFFLQSIFQNESAIIVHSNSLLAIFGGVVSSCPRLLSYSPAVSNACLKRYSSPNDSSIAPQSPRAPSTFTDKFNAFLDFSCEHGMVYVKAMANFIKEIMGLFLSNLLLKSQIAQKRNNFFTQNNMNELAIGKSSQL